MGVESLGNTALVTAGMELSPSSQLACRFKVEATHEVLERLDSVWFFIKTVFDFSLRQCLILRQVGVWFFAEKVKTLFTYSNLTGQILEVFDTYYIKILAYCRPRTCETIETLGISEPYLYIRLSLIHISEPTRPY